MSDKIIYGGLILDIKDIDTAGRRVKFAAAKFGNLDSDNDVIVRGAFAKSIQERGPESQGNRKIKMLRYHDFQHEIGLVKSLEETTEHLMVIADLGNSTKGNDAFLDYQDGIITEHSIGFMLVQDKINILDSGIRELKEVILMEVSAVTFGANSETPVFGVSGKEEFKQEYLEKIHKTISGLTMGLKNPYRTDENLMRLEENLAIAQKQYNSLIELSRLNLDTQGQKPKNESTFFNNLI